MARAKKLRNIHPGEVLHEEFLKPMRLTQYRLAKEIRVPITRISEICRAKRSVTADTAVRLAQFFGTSRHFWLGLQADFDLELALRANRAELAAIRPYRAA